VCDPDYDPEGKLILGNVNNQPIHELWHSDKIKKIRDCFSKMSPEYLDPCKYCIGS
jgi:hypothetical protein